jgi:hypothetical protein
MLRMGARQAGASSERELDRIERLSRRACDLSLTTDDTQHKVSL